MTTDITLEPPAQEPRRRRNPAPFILAGVVIVLVIYYVSVAISGTLQSRASVDIEGQSAPSGPDYMTLRVLVDQIDQPNQVAFVSVLPVGRGVYAGDEPGELGRNVRVEVYSGGVTTAVAAFPGESVVNATTMSLFLQRGDGSFPFDDPYADFELSVQDESSGVPVPFVIEMVNAAQPWQLTASRGEVRTADSRELYRVTIDAQRDALTIAIVSFYLLSMIVTTLLAIVTIGSALLRRSLEFANLVWLSATLLSFPALRAAMPGAPPIGATMDYLVMIPCLAMIAGLLAWAGGYMIWRESHTLRSRHITRE